MNVMMQDARARGEAKRVEEILVKGRKVLDDQHIEVGLATFNLAWHLDTSEVTARSYLFTLAFEWDRHNGDLPGYEDVCQLVGLEVQ